MKKLIIFALALASCSPEDVSETDFTGVSRYEAKIVNGHRTNQKRPATDPNAYCGEVVESGTEQLPGQNVQYQWVVVCLN